MDLSVFEVAPQGAVLHIRHPITDQPMVLDDGTAVTVMLVGMDSTEWRGHQRAAIDKGLRQKRAKPVTAEEIEDEALDALVACFKDWTGFRLDGKDIPFSAHAAKDLMRRLPHLKRQVDAFISDHANFLKASATT